MTEERASIATVHEGAVIEAIDDALQECYANILDPNTEPTVTRTVTVKITLRPDSSREVVDLAAQCKTTLAPAKPVDARLVVGGTQDHAIAAEWRSPQMDIHDYLPDGVSAIGRKES